LSFSRNFFNWYNNDHYHSGIGLVTPASLHYGQASKIVASRRHTLALAHTAHAERFVHGIPTPPKLPSAVWINPPLKQEQDKKKGLPENNCPQKPQDASLTHPRSDYPLASCVPAELASVSSDESTIPSCKPLNTRAMPEKIPGVRGLAPEKPKMIHPTQIALH
jgi:hypothetical protein